MECVVLKEKSCTRVADSTVIFDPVFTISILWICFVLLYNSKKVTFHETLVYQIP